LIVNFIGCATAPYVSPTGPLIPPAMPGTYHRVERGQTLWKISKMYNVELDDVARINRILDASAIEAGQLVFIPTTSKPVAIPTDGLSDDFGWPIRGRVISSFGQNYNNMINKGINILPAATDDIIFASRGGRVVFYSEDFAGYGSTIIIDHGDGLSSVYARNAEVFIKAGDNVQKGARIARVGSAGRDKNKYLHFEIRKKHVPQNPYYYLP